ncbi:MAG: hypothetical protein ABIB47_06305 [Candidatus Woesearchaeota archaeon]
MEETNAPLLEVLSADKNGLAGKVDTSTEPINSQHCSCYCNCDCVCICGDTAYKDAGADLYALDKK